MKAVIISIQPYWAFLIIAKSMGWGIKQHKKIEVRKNYPKAEDWNKVVKIYCSKDKKSFDKIPEKYRPAMKKFLGKVIGHFVCDRIDAYPYDENIQIPTPMYDGDESCIECGAGYYITCGELKETCLTNEQFENYGKGKILYGWHITDLVIYDEPKELGEFFTPIGKRPSYILQRPFQSWGYVEEKEKNNETKRERNEND